MSVNAVEAAPHVSGPAAGRGSDPGEGGEHSRDVYEEDTKELLGRVWSPADGERRLRRLKERSSLCRQAVATPSWDELGFELYQCREGEFLVRSERRSRCRFQTFRVVWGLVGKDEALEGVDMGQMCFLDLETTG